MPIGRDGGKRKSVRRPFNGCFAPLAVTQPPGPPLQKRTCVHLPFLVGMGGKLLVRLWLAYLESRRRGRIIRTLATSCTSTQDTTRMDLQTFRQAVDGAAPGIATCKGDLKAEYDYVGLQHGSDYSRDAVSDALYARIRDGFTSASRH